MDVYSSQITALVEQLSRLPGIGAKSAQRLAFHILNMPEDQVAGLTRAMTNAKKMCIIAKNAVRTRIRSCVRSVPVIKEITE